MGVNELRKYVKERGKVTIPEVQLKFSLGYKAVRELFAKWEKEGVIELREDLTYYVCTSKREETSPQGGGRLSDNTQEDGSRADLERRREYVRFLREHIAEEQAEENDAEFLKLCVRVLNYCINIKRASPSLIQNKFGTGYFKACQIVDWMCTKDYITDLQGVMGGRVTLSREKFNELYGHLLAEGENDLVTPSDVGKLITLLKAVRDKKSQPVTRDRRPRYSQWDDNCEFANTVVKRFADLIREHPEGVDGAIREAESRLNGVRDTHDRAMVEVYEKVVYDLKGLTPEQYEVMKKRFGGN